jgi:3'-5' exonuclease
VFAVFDLETRIDKALVRAVLHRQSGLDDEQAYEQTRADLVARRGPGGDFFPLAFHIPVSVVVGEVDDARVLRAVRVLGASGYSEAGIVAEFWQYVEQRGVTLVSFNGRGFDLPVLELAALRQGLCLPRYFASGARDGADEAHYDLYDFVTNGGTTGLRGGFDLLARLTGLPGKGEIDGGSVQALWEAGRLADIHAYCRRDVIQTYFVFLRIELLRGRVRPPLYAAALEATRAFRTELDGA